MVIAPAKMKKNNVKNTGDHIYFQTKYMARTKDMGELNELKPIYTNCAGNSSKEIVAEMQLLASLRPEIKKGTYQVVLSPERNDRTLTYDEWRRAIDIYREKRGLGGAPFVAYLHTDGNAKRHPHHVHLMFVRVRSDGSLVSDSWDSSKQREASRQIELELNLLVNAGADEKHKYNGRDRQVQRERAAERRNDKVSPNVDATIVARVIGQCQNAYELKRGLEREGIECRFRYRNNQIYAWSLRNTGSREWTSGSKLTASNEFGWGKVQAQLDTNFVDRQPIKSGRRHPARLRGLNASKRPLQHPQRLDLLTDAGTAEAFESLQRMLGHLAKIKVKPPVLAKPQRKKTTQQKRLAHAVRRPKL